MRTQGEWDTHFMKQALGVAEMSDDRATKVGCVLVNSDHIQLASGTNTFPRGITVNGEDVELMIRLRERQVGTSVPDTVRDAKKAAIEARHERPAKYEWTEHAERNAIYAHARIGGPALLGCTAYVPWFPCVPCTRALIQVGMDRLVAYRPDFNHVKYGPDFRLAVEMLEEARVHITYMPEPEKVAA